MFSTLGVSVHRGRIPLVHRSDIMIHARDIMSTLEGYHNLCGGDIMSPLGGGGV